MATPICLYITCGDIHAAMVELSSWNRECFVFFYEMVSQVLPQEETEERFRETNIRILSSPKNKRHNTPTGPHGKDTRVFRKQKTGVGAGVGGWNCLGHLPPLLGFLLERQSRAE